MLCLNYMNIDDRIVLILMEPITLASFLKMLFSLQSIAFYHDLQSLQWVYMCICLYECALCVYACIPIVCLHMCVILCIAGRKVEQMQISCLHSLCPIF